MSIRNIKYLLLNEKLSSGAIKRIIEKKDNLTLGYFSTLPLRDSVMSSSFVYYASNLVWMIPPGQPFNEFEKLLMPFHNDIWICCSIIFSIAFLVIFVLKFCATDEMRNFIFGWKIISPELNIIRIILNGSIPRLPTRNFARSILIIFMIFCFIIQNSYTGRLFYFMRNSLRHPDLDTTRELLDRNFTFYTISASKDLLVGMPRVLERLTVLTSSEFGALTLRTVDSKIKIALLTSEDHLAWRNIIASPERYFHHAGEVIFRNNIVIYMHKQSCLVREVNTILLNLMSGGLIRYFASTFINPSFLRSPNTSNTKSLNFEQLDGAFELLAIGLLLSFIVFTIEVTFTRSSKLFHYYFRRQ